MDPFTLFFIAFAVLAASYVIMSFLVKTPEVKPTSSDDIKFPQADEGTPQSVHFGDVWVTGPMVIWYGNYRTKAIKKGGK